MLVLTDRRGEIARLKRDLNLISPCRVMAVEEVGHDTTTDKLIISDVATNSAGQIEQLRKAIARHRRDNAPLLCLLRDNTHLAKTQAFAIGASLTLPVDASREALHAAVTQLLNPEGASLIDQTTSTRAGAQKAALVLADIMDSVEGGGFIEQESLSAGTDLVLQAVALTDVGGWLDVVGSYDDVTYQHILLVAGLAAAFAIDLGFDMKDRRRLTQAALLHDVGKAHIPLEILTKPGALTEGEMAVMRTHATIGYDLLCEQGGFSDELLDVVRHHHEYLNGSGYPDGLRGEQISDMVRLMTICDIYAALIERRSYKKAIAPEIAYQIMRDMDGKLDRDFLRAFAKVVFPDKVN
jgi:putative nucleotidyltransferase with HDIG domain